MLRATPLDPIAVVPVVHLDELVLLRVALALLLSLVVFPVVLLAVVARTPM